MTCETWASALLETRVARRPSPSPLAGRDLSLGFSRRTSFRVPGHYRTGYPGQRSPTRSPWAFEWRPFRTQSRPIPPGHRPVPIRPEHRPGAVLKGRDSSAQDEVLGISPVPAERIVKGCHGTCAGYRRGRRPQSLRQESSRGWEIHPVLPAPLGLARERPGSLDACAAPHRVAMIPR